MWPLEWVGRRKIEQDYELGVIIGQGKFGSVVLCRSKVSGDEFACKTLQKGEDCVHQEVEVMQHLSGHPGVVTLKAVYENADSFHFVMELCPGGWLLDQLARVGRYSEQRAANILKELILVIKYCHDMGVVHRDIKPENILLTMSGQMKLADFGLAVRIANEAEPLMKKQPLINLIELNKPCPRQRLTGVVGSPAYVAPEVLGGDYSETVDIWSAGVLLHALLVGVLPFQGDSLKTVFEAIKKDNLDFSGGEWESISQPARDLIAHMMTRDVSARFTADEVLRHPWILFYTESTLRMLTFNPGKRDHVQLTQQQLTVIPGSERDKILGSNSLSDDSSPALSSANSAKIIESEDCGFVDVLAVAISRVRISEPKRSRLCSPARPIQGGCSSSLKVNRLCTAC